MGGKNFLIGSSVGVNLPQKIALLHFQNLLQKGWKIHTSSGTFWSKIHSKGLGKLKSHSFLTVKMRRKIYMCQPETILLIVSFWLDAVKQWSLTKSA